MERCDFPRCQNPIELKYIERNICGIHWEKLCNADSKTENKLLSKIDLVRNKDGAVVPKK